MDSGRMPVFKTRCRGDIEMLTEKQLERMLEKLVRFEVELEPLLFHKIDTVTMEKYQTDEALDVIPDDRFFEACRFGDIWGGEGNYCWFKGGYRVPAEYEGADIFLYPQIGGYEAMLWVNEIPYGIFTSKIVVNSHGNHYCDMIRKHAVAGEVLELALEYYAHHYVMGTQPFEKNLRENYEYLYEDVTVCVKDEEICDFYFDLKTLNQMVQVLDKNSFRRADIVKTLYKVHEMIYYDYEHISDGEFRKALKEAGLLLKNQLAKKNSQSAPIAGLIGHSHMDTAWLWHQGETLKKCARTYANQMNLMDQYPEYLFIQSSAYHGALMKEHYPGLFQKIRERVKEGRYEPNGGVWIECDCNLPSGEYLVRQFVWGQQFTKENFDYMSDSFWLPDTFGYSVSLPQIMQGCGIRYFLTTKMAWGDTNRFPYDTFYWKGLDGSKVLVHLNKTHIWPEPNSLMEFVVNGEADSIKEKSVSNSRLLSYGFGDGGGGPQFEMIEMARRMKDTEGLPKAEHMTVSDFMKNLENTVEYPSTYSGELYLELHRGTLTNNHTIKRNNRLAEIALHDLEYLSVREGLNRGCPGDEARIRPLMASVLKNQFHDILPGTCIPRAHEEAIEEMTEVIKTANEYIREICREEKGVEMISVSNTLSFQRDDVIYLDYKEGMIVEGGYCQQLITNLQGERKLAVWGIRIPAFSSVTLKLVPGVIVKTSVFSREGDTLTAPHEIMVFNKNGYIKSYIDIQEQRELRGEGYPLNTFLIGEEVSSAWDSWDVDADFECRLKDKARLISQEIASDGMVEYRIRSEYRLTENSSLRQDMIVYANSKEVRFETIMDWRDDHRFLKTAFDTTIFTDYARQEVQFGYIKRSTNRNTSIEKAKFEVFNHKYTDLSEMRYGAALLNDCKYGISVEDSNMHLSLHKGGCRPDFHGDKGMHMCCYAFVPHSGEFGVENVVKPAYMLNLKPIITQGCWEEESLLCVEADNIIVETVKPAEHGEQAFVLRLYEAEGTYIKTRLNINIPYKKAELTNMLEEVEAALEKRNDIGLIFRPFEIKTLKVTY